MASFGQLLAQAFPNNKVQAAAPKQTPVLNTAVTKPTTSFGDLMNPSSATAAKGSTSKAVLASSAKPNPIQSAVTSAPSGNNPTQNSNQQTGTTLPSFSFDWTAADNAALEKLTPYYQGLLDQAQGDVNLAKSRIEEDYQTGMRQRQEDQTMQGAEDQRLAMEETRNTMGGLNSRGVLVGEKEAGDTSSKAPTSDYANSYYLNPMRERQQARSLAIQRAFSRQQDQADTTKSRQFQDAGTQFDRYKMNLEEEKKNKAINQMAPLQYQQELSKYNAALSGVLNA